MLDPTDCPEFDLFPNSKVVNKVLMIAQIPHESQVQKCTLFVPRSQIHCVLWNVWIWRGSASAVSLELGMLNRSVDQDPVRERKARTDKLHGFLRRFVGGESRRPFQP